MDSKNLASAGFKGFDNWELIKISSTRISREVIPESPGVYILRQKGCRKIPYNKSDIVKIGETRDLSNRIWEYMRESRIACRVATCRRTAWKVRHFMTYLSDLEVSVKPLKPQKDAKTFQNKMIATFHKKYTEKPVLEGSFEDYLSFCKKIGVSDEELPEHI